MVTAPRIAAFAGSALFLAACTSSNTGPAPDSLGSAPAPQPATVQEAAYCPTVTLREGTAILTKMEGERQAYVASVTDATRDCRVVDGQLRLEVGIKGQVVPGVAARNGAVKLPIRVAILVGQDVVYSKLGSVSVTVTKGAAPGTFLYVDRAISLPQPTQRNVTIFAGFDEGPAPAGAQLRSDAR
ncbi:hypothetical protein ASG48_01115 [Aurantimonas sp. Leaf443]|nr:hypothetical protein ASG48_01115 [Aurantimonas sp. Leaf443]